jgi:hypothetical protein
MEEHLAVHLPGSGIRRMGCSLVILKEGLTGTDTIR